MQQAGRLFPALAVPHRAELPIFWNILTHVKNGGEMNGVLFANQIIYTF